MSAAGFGADFELFDKLGNGGRRLENKIDHRRRTHERAIDQLIEQILDRPAVFANTLRADHAAAALERMERPPDRDQGLHVVRRIAPGRQVAFDRGNLLFPPPR